MSVAVVTGASRGIGLAIALRLLETHRVVNLSRTPADGLDNICVDVCDPKQVSSAFERITESIGAPEVLVNNAGFVEPKGILEIGIGEWNKTITTNLSGAFFCTREFARLAKVRGGKVVNVASTAGTRASPGWAAYAAAKAGLINLSLTSAEELRPYGIKVYCVAPGRCATELRRKLAPDEDPATIMQPDEVADFVAWLVHDGHLVDGQVLTVRRPPN